MAEKKATRLSKAAREFNVGISTIVEFLHKKGHDIDSNPNTKLDAELYDLLVDEYSTDLSVKKDAEKLTLKTFREKAEKAGEVPAETEKESTSDEQELLINDKTTGTEELKRDTPAASPEKADTQEKSEETEKAAEEAPVAEKSADIEEVAEPENEDVKPEEVVAEKKAETPPEEKEPVEEEEAAETEEAGGPRVIGRIDLDSMNQKTRPKKKTKKEKDAEKEARSRDKTETEAPEAEQKEPVQQEPEKQDEVTASADEAPEEKVEEKPEKDKDEGHIPTQFEKLKGLSVVGKIDLPEKRVPKKKQPVASSSDKDADTRKKRKRIRKDTSRVDLDDDRGSGKKKEKPGGKRKKRPSRPEVSDEDVQNQINDTFAKLTTKGTKSKAPKYRREKRDTFQQRLLEEEEQHELDRKVLKVTEFVSVNELASMMDVQATEVIQTCMNLGLFVSINQRLDAETMALVADEFGFTVEFISADVLDVIAEEIDEEATLEPRPPIVTVMGHVDHGKTKLLDYVRSANVVAGEAGGITQHIGAYGVELEDKKKITFLDTPGHEAFTAMRARGAQITDVAIIVVAADDGVKPQTVEAINHAAAAGVPIVFAINKVDRPTANPEKIKEELANMNYMVEDWGGKYQSQEISALKGLHIDELLEKVLLEAELLDLKANPNRKAVGTIIESTLDRGRGNVATMLVESGTLNIGDVVIAGHYYGHVKAMFNERGNKIDKAGPSTPVMILGLNGSPQAGDRFNVMGTDREAKEIANKREQLQREQDLRTKKHITLDEIGRRIAIGNFQELNVIVKGDVDGSVEALADSLIKLSTDEIQVNIKHQAVGQISESDILLAAASNAIVIGFQVRPSLSARRLAEKEQIDIRLYSIIYDAIEQVRAAMEGMLSPEIKEEIVATLEVLEAFKITKVGTIAGCIVKEGKIKRTSKIRLIRDGIVVYTGELGSLKRFKDDAKEVVTGLECGLNILNFNDIKVGDIVEAYEETEIRKTL
ncbi:MAG: translation initiation factor IF-2 [Bacteroidales bacterium]|nr:translation initiation factor IF-2 [Bacteroidales bacterium]